jgi:hypothetical protein
MALLRRCSVPRHWSRAPLLLLLLLVQQVLLVGFVQRGRRRVLLPRQHRRQRLVRDVLPLRPPCTSLWTQQLGSLCAGTQGFYVGMPAKVCGHDTPCETCPQCAPPQAWQPRGRCLMGRQRARTRQQASRAANTSLQHSCNLNLLRFL